MATVFLHSSNLVLLPFSDHFRTPTPLLHRHNYHSFSHRHHQISFLRGSLSVARFGFKQGFFPDPDSAEGVVRDLLGKTESLIYTIADAAVSASASSEAVGTSKQSNDWFSGITNYMEAVLKILKDGLSTLHVPYAYGFAIILLTVLVKAATFPLTKKQVESAMSMRSLQPQIKVIQQRYAGNQERIQLETARLYKLAGINPLAGCLPTLVTIPVWIGLYRALSNVADEGLLAEGFFWIPSLAGPTTIAARQSGSGISWLFPFKDGQPPLGWSDTFAYLVLPLLLVISQYISVQIMQSSQNNDPNMKTSQALTKLLPLMIGYFALSVPSGLSLYWFTNNILSTAQQVWLQKLGGAKIQVKELTDDVIKQDQLEIPKSISEPKLIEKESKRSEKLTADGIRPGERFRQLKEQEARKRREREEKEKRKAQEAAAVQTNQMTSGSNLVVERSEEIHSETNNNKSSNVGVNGNISREESNKDEKTTTAFKTEVSIINNRDEELQSSQLTEKAVAEVHTTSTTTGVSNSGDNKDQAGQE